MGHIFDSSPADDEDFEEGSELSIAEESTVSESDLL